jgi:hypothetical protein
MLPAFRAILASSTIGRKGSPAQQTEDAALLEQNGYDLRWLKRNPSIRSVTASKMGQTTKLEWVVDSDFRFFPTIRDEVFGFVLHPVDLATNKVAAAYGRHEPRDVVYSLTIHERIVPLGASFALQPVKRWDSHPKESLTRSGGSPAALTRTFAGLPAIRKLIQAR